MHTTTTTKIGRRSKHWSVRSPKTKDLFGEALLLLLQHQSQTNVCTPYSMSCDNARVPGCACSIASRLTLDSSVCVSLHHCKPANSWRASDSLLIRVLFNEVSNNSPLATSVCSIGGRIKVRIAPCIMKHKTCR